MKKKSKISVYEIITNRIIERLEKGNIPWAKPWVGGDQVIPMNGTTMKPYRGINVLLTSMMGYANPHWMTFKQAQKLGAQVIKGEKGTPLVYWNFVNKKDDKGEDKKIPFMKYYTVFNADQIEDLDKKFYPKPVKQIIFKKINRCEKIVAKFKKAPKIQHKEQRAYYRPSKDMVNMPASDTFKTREEYYSTLFHELGHSTGHETRLNRKGITDMNLFGSHDYSKEELVAEMTASFLCGVSGIENKTIDNSASYLQGWLKVLKKDSKLIVGAAQQAQKSADHIQGIKLEVTT